MNRFQYPDLSDPVVLLAAKMIVDSYPKNDQARAELDEGTFDIRQAMPEHVFAAFVAFARNALSADQQAKPEVQ
ncbi:hypothetical protein [Xanthomonas campestris]|uniref:hypothetical protein n=1 Tax=Xanthomonas campestris TaxID=339 RepID=UPI00236832E2|nr:hypothetical protein [Xanthomonas campestris]WDI91969.1 hypothetical protein JH280_11530 [Xanthomonas campestris]